MKVGERKNVEVEETFPMNPAGLCGDGREDNSEWRLQVKPTQNLIKWINNSPRDFIKILSRILVRGFRIHVTTAPVAFAPAEDPKSIFNILNIIKLSLFIRQTSPLRPLTPAGLSRPFMSTMFRLVLPLKEILSPLSIELFVSSVDH